MVYERRINLSVISLFYLTTQTRPFRFPTERGACRELPRCRPPRCKGLLDEGRNRERRTTTRSSNTSQRHAATQPSQYLACASAANEGGVAVATQGLAVAVEKGVRRQDDSDGSAEERWLEDVVRRKR